MLTSRLQPLDCIMPLSTELKSALLSEMLDPCRYAHPSVLPQLQSCFWHRLHEAQYNLSESATTCLIESPALSFNNWMVWSAYNSHSRTSLPIISSSSTPAWIDIPIYNILEESEGRGIANDRAEQKIHCSSHFPSLPQYFFSTHLLQLFRTSQGRGFVLGTAVPGHQNSRIQV